jgi:hypothetical protein
MDLDSNVEVTARVWGAGRCREGASSGCTATSHARCRCSRTARPRSCAPWDHRPPLCLPSSACVQRLPSTTSNHPPPPLSPPPPARSLLLSGMDVARINCAHGDAAGYERLVSAVRQASREVRDGSARPTDIERADAAVVAVAFDIKGPEVRVPAGGEGGRGGGGSCRHRVSRARAGAGRPLRRLCATQLHWQPRNPGQEGAAVRVGRGWGANGSGTVAGSNVARKQPSPPPLPPRVARPQPATDHQSGAGNQQQPGARRVRGLPATGGAGEGDRGGGGGRKGRVVSLGAGRCRETAQLNVAAKPHPAPRPLHVDRRSGRAS